LTYPIVLECYHIAEETPTVVEKPTIKRKLPKVGNISGLKAFAERERKKRMLDALSEYTARPH
jgi:hypothetical protein